MAMKQDSLSEAIRRACRECGLSQAALARRAGLDVTVMSRFLRGIRGLTIPNLDRLAAVLNLRIVSDGPPKAAPMPTGKPGRKPGRKTGKK